MVVSVVSIGCSQSLVHRFHCHHASYNEIRELPDEIRELEFVTSFKIRHNQLQQLPEAFWDLTKLTSLDLSKYAVSSCLVLCQCN